MRVEEEVSLEKGTAAVSGTETNVPRWYELGQTAAKAVNYEITAVPDGSYYVGVGVHRSTPGYFHLKMRTVDCS